MNQPEETKLLPCPCCQKQPFEYKPNSCWCENIDCMLYGYAFNTGKWNTRITPSLPHNEIGKLGLELFQIWSGGVYGWDATSEIEKTRWSRLAVALRDSQPSPTWAKDAAAEIDKLVEQWNSNTPDSITMTEQILTRHAKK